jgi:hypothetical protein
MKTRQKKHLYGCRTVIKRGLLENPPFTSMIFPAINSHLQFSIATLD